MNIILSLLRYIVIESKYYHSYVLLISLKKYITQSRLWLMNGLIKYKNVEKNIFYSYY